MRTKLFYFFIAVFFMNFSSNAQVISLIGPGGSGDWGVDLPMVNSGDNINYSLSYTSVGGPCKFRQDSDWAINWGSTAFPSGIGVQNGANIPTIAGNYTVTINIVTGAYNFAADTPIPVVKLVGTAVDGGEVALTPTDAENFSVKTTLLDGTAKFDVDGALLSDSAFPSGVAFEGSSAIPVTGGLWLVKLNVATGEYSFEVPPAEEWAITGSAIVDHTWGTDLLLATTDGITYTSVAPFDVIEGAFKFRIAGNWDTARGSSDAFPTGVATPSGGDIPVTADQAGSYTLTYNALTGEFTFTKQLSTKGFSSANFKVYPNPSQNVWNFTSTSERIESVKIVDVLGKNVMTVSPKSTTVSVDGSSLTKGIYFAKIATAKATETIKLMKN